ncbi:hypothetical protein AAFF_G00043880 [Aldrovandia affinis]|uniref:CARD domain-containing protein n=1 Tax=Aldrovandia affinis TaxID=143900 RepID=A0AAD7S240_9TELE|nr:hypothetical protein AAFF_G00043880 [Aldrovandia affinis]
MMDLQKASQLMQTVIRKGRRTCQLFCKLLESCDPLLCERVAGSSASDSVLETPQPLHIVSQIDRQSMVPTYIINIHDSTLNNCIIGSNNAQRMTTDRQCPPSHNAENARDEAGRCSCRCGQQGSAQSSPAPQSLHVQSSNLEFVIIGDNNTMVVEGVDREEEEEEEEEEEQALV